jgi:DNA gyrase subunit B
MKVEADIRRLSHRYEEPVLRTLMKVGTLAADQNESQLQEWVSAFDAALPKLDPTVRQISGGAADYQARLEYVAATDDGEIAEDASWSVVIEKRRHGVTYENRIAGEFFARADYHRIATLGTELADMFTGEAIVARGEKSLEVEGFPQAIAWLMDEARRGQSIQRYKGLGEMNPDQLWDTTVNPETRRLMQVKVEDAIRADEIFTTLMGDHVEPRREFIEQNALAVSNLDV